MSNLILTLAGWDPDKHGRKPRKKPTAGKQRATPKSSRLIGRSNIRFNPIIGAYESYHAEKDSHSWKRESPETDFGQRTGKLSDQEIEYFELAIGMNVDKAAALKTYWAAGLSAKEASAQFTSYGYGERTVKKYWSVFNMQLSPLETR